MGSCLGKGKGKNASKGGDKGRSVEEKATLEKTAHFLPQSSTSNRPNTSSSSQAEGGGSQSSAPPSGEARPKEPSGEARPKEPSVESRLKEASVPSTQANAPDAAQKAAAAPNTQSATAAAAQKTTSETAAEAAPPKAAAPVDTIHRTASINDTRSKEKDTKSANKSKKSPVPAEEEGRQTAGSDEESSVEDSLRAEETMDSDRDAVTAPEYFTATPTLPTRTLRLRVSPQMQSYVEATMETMTEGCSSLIDGSEFLSSSTFRTPSPVYDENSLPSLQTSSSVNETECEDTVTELPSSDYDHRPIRPLPTPFRKVDITPTRSIESMCDGRGRVRRNEKVLAYLDNKRRSYDNGSS